MSDEITTTAAPSIGAAVRCHGVCPWYLGYLLANPLRRLVQDPDRLLRPLVSQGMTVLEPGCGMGFFSLPAARLVGPAGRVVCVDLQPKMIDGLRGRARRAGLLDRIETVVCGGADLGVGAWEGRVDLALAIHMVHEVPDVAGFLRQVHAALRPGGSLLVVEPKGHVSAEGFERTLVTAEEAGFARGPRPERGGPLAALLVRPHGRP